MNSNMRRHYRNHTSPGLARPSSAESRRRHRKARVSNLVFIHPNSTGSPNLPHADAASSIVSSPPPSDISMTEESEDETSDSVPSYAAYSKREIRATAAYPECKRPRSQRGVGGYKNIAPRTVGIDTQGVAISSRSSSSSSPYSQSHIRGSMHWSSSNISSSVSTASSPSPSPEEALYNPSAPYSRSFADTRVSTALRPAFNSLPSPRNIKQEPYAY